MYLYLSQIPHKSLSSITSLSSFIVKYALYPAKLINLTSSFKYFLKPASMRCCIVASCINAIDLTSNCIFLIKSSALMTLLPQLVDFVSKITPCISYFCFKYIIMISASLLSATSKSCKTNCILLRKISVVCPAPPTII